MGTENHVWTHSRNGAVTASRFQDLQDYWVIGWEMSNSELGPTYALSGEFSGYQQFQPAAATTIPLDTSRDWRGRILEVEIVQVTAANELPQQANYDPNLAGGSWDWNLMFTGDGASLAAVPVGTRWNPPGMANCYFFAANAAGGGIVAGNLCFRNNGGAQVFFMIRAHCTSDVR